jgi:prolipoprotein diacylglyceryltransferase
VVALAGFWIRLGNLMNSEIIGKPTTLPWGFVFKKLKSLVLQVLIILPSYMKLYPIWLYFLFSFGTT